MDHTELSEIMSKPQSLPLLLVEEKFYTKKCLKQSTIDFSLCVFAAMQGNNGQHLKLIFPNSFIDFS